MTSLSGTKLVRILRVGRLRVLSRFGATTIRMD